MDRRFSHDAWYTHPVFSFLKEQYHQYNHTIKMWVEELSCDMGPEHKECAQFLADLWADIFCPAHYSYFHPEYWENFQRDYGKSYTHPLSEIVHTKAEDFFRNEMEHRGMFIPLADTSVCRLGKDMANTPGYVIWSDEICELLYFPVSGSYVNTPVFIIPSWVNKYYIFDLTPENSFVHFLHEKHHSVFIVSWKNPLVSLEKTFQDYLSSALAAYTHVMTHHHPCHIVSYCAGSLLSSYMVAYLEKIQKVVVPTLTHLMPVFDYNGLDKIRFFFSQSKESILNGWHIRQIFLMLRARDVMWPAWIDYYCLAKKPIHSPIFYWNDDPMNVDGTLHSDVMQLFLEDSVLIQKKPLIYKGHTLVVKDMQIPTMIVASQKDHITPWKSCYAGHKIFPETQFLLVDSGHIASIIYPSKYTYYHSHNISQQAITPEEWKKNSTIETHTGWHEAWITWLNEWSTFGGIRNDIDISIYAQAPGSYAKERTPLPTE